MARRGKSGGLCCVKSSLVLFNIVTMLGGVTTLAIGAWLLHQSINADNNETTLIESVSRNDATPYSEEFQGVSIIMVALGSLVTFISFLGCFGAFANSRCLLLCYLISVTLILILQLMVSVVVIVYRQPMNESIRDELRDHMKTKYTPNGPYGMAWDVVQQNFQCCGVDSYKDWYKVSAWSDENIVPDSCCRAPQNATGCGRMNENNWNEKGCIGQIQQRVMEQLHIVACAILAMVFLQLYGIIASTLLFYHTKYDNISKSQRTSTPYKPYSYERAGMM